MAYLTFHKWLVSVCNIHNDIEWYKPKPVIWEKWDTLLFYKADDILHFGQEQHFDFLQYWLQLN